MNVVMKKPTWNALGLDSPVRRNVALAAFYLGMNVLEIEDLLSRAEHDPELEYVVSTAVLSGLSSDKDKLSLEPEYEKVSTRDNDQI